MVICLAMDALLDAPEAPMPAVAPAFFSKIFQNFKLSSAASDMLAKILSSSRIDSCSYQQ